VWISAHAAPPTPGGGEGVIVVVGIVSATTKLIYCANFKNTNNKPLLLNTKILLNKPHSSNIRDLKIRGVF